MIPEKSFESKQFFISFEEEEHEVIKAMEQHNQEIGPEDEDEEDLDDDEEFDYEDNRSFLIPGEEEEIIRRDDEDDNETGLSKEYF